MAEQLVLRGTLEGHSGWVTSLATSLEKYVHVDINTETQLYGAQGLYKYDVLTVYSAARTCSCLRPATRL